MIFPTIYKRTQTGAVQTWFAEVQGDSYQTTSGQIDGKKTSSGWVVCEPKNVGKSNGTTAEQQAIAEVEAIYKKRLEKEYRKDIKDIDTESFFQPMLATKWADRKDKLGDKDLFFPKEWFELSDGEKSMIVCNHTSVFSIDRNKWVEVRDLKEGEEIDFTSYPNV